MSSNIALHVGFSKTGTTTLQQFLFSKHSQIEYLGKPYTDDILKSHLYRLIGQESLVYDHSPLAEYFSKKILKTEHGSKRLILISDEVLVSYSKVLDKGMVAQRLKKVFPGARVIFTIRNQLEILKAAYLSRGRLLLNVPDKYEGLHVSFEDWLELSYRSIERSYLGHVDYFKTIDYYSGLFGRDNVCILLLEELIDRPGEYVKKLAGFLGIDYDEALALVAEQHANRGITRYRLEFESLITKFFPFHHFFLVLGLVKLYFLLKRVIKKDQYAEVSIPVGWSERLGGLYCEGNRKLSSVYQLPVEKYGYPL
jgi:hypothetical protein